MAGSFDHNWTFDGKRTHWVAMGTSEDHPNVTLVSLHDTVKVMFVTKTGFYKDIEPLVAKFEENMDNAD